MRCLALLFALAAFSCAAQERGQVRLGHNRAWNNSALIIGISEGYFQRAGVTVVERSFNNPADIVQAIATGDLDAGVSPSGVLFTALQRGVKVKGVALVQGGQIPSVSFTTRADSGINSVADLKGKTIAIAGFGGTTDLTLRYWLTRAGIDPKTEVKVTFVPFHLMLPSLMNKQIDAAPLDAMLNIKARQQFPGQTKVLFSYADVTQQAIGNLHVNGLILNFGDAFVERDRDTAVRFMEAYLRAIRDVHADPKKVLAQWSAASKDDTIRSLEAPPTLPEDGKIYLDAFKFEADQALKFGYIKQPMDVAKAIDNSLLDEAARRLK
jgi:ABC-type nitrate/sulfonate/bicarbonate transport system substrate-binding protein